MKANRSVLLVSLFLLTSASVDATAKSSGGGGACSAIAPTNPPITSAASVACANSGCPDTSLNGTGFVITNTDGSVPKQVDIEGAQAVQQIVMPDGSTRILAIGTTSVSNGSGFSQGVALVRYNSDGTLDAGFGTNGTVTTFSPASTGGVTDGILDGSGRILVLSGVNNDGSFVVFRFLSSGTLDTSFNGTGYSSVINLTPRSLSLDAAGNILVGASYYPGKRTVYGAVVRLTPNGLLDTSFGSGGQATITSLGDVSGLTTQGGYILAGGGSQIIRLNSNGTLDTTFGGGSGVAATNLCGYGYGIYQLKIDGNGNILAVGSGAVTSGGPAKIAVARFNANGKIDATFGLASSSGSGRTGFTVLDVFGSSNTANSAAIFTDGSGDFGVGGHAEITSGFNVSHYYFAAKFDANGALVPTFGGSHGVVALDWGSANNYTLGRGVNGLVVEPTDGKLLIGTGTGFSSGVYTGYNFAVARLWP